MSPVSHLALRAFLPLALSLACVAPARADTPIALWKAFDGRVNFTGTQVSLRTGSNSNGKGNTRDCTVTAPTTNRTAILTVPTGATVVSAQLYWAGSGPSDSTVTFESRDVTAGRKYTSASVGSGFDYFGGAADVTAIVQAKGSGTYNFSGLTVSNGSPWCASQGVLGGFALLVVYSHPSQPERVLNIYEGFRYVQNGEVVVNANNFRWNRTMTPVDELARVGHISWEGDPTLSQDGERLLFEGKEVFDTLNPAGNQFNSASNINNDDYSLGVDFDAYDTKVTLWSGFDATVTTTYRTGQDMVLLNAEILVVPTIPVSDLSVALARSGPFEVGQNAEYTVTVTNNGPYTEAGPITVSSTLPAGMTYVSGSGSGWTCSANGANGVCTYRGALAPGTSAPPLQVTAAVKTTGEKTSTVTVAGTGDDNPANDSASDTATAIDRTVSTDPTPATLDPYLFTDSACTPGIKIGAAGQGCKLYTAAVVGGRAAPVFITATREGTPAAPSDTAATTRSMQFALACINPVAGTVAAAYAGAAIPACAAAGQPLAWSNAVDVSFPAKTASVKYDFVYNDVGQVRLSLREGGGTAATEPFVSAPLRIEFKSIRYGNIVNPGNTTPASAGFAPAGATLTVEIGARLDGAAGSAPAFAPNFGNEKFRPGLALGRSALPGVGIASLGELFETGARAWKGGIMATEASWSEAGAIGFGTGLVDAADPADAGKQNFYLGVPVPGSTAAVGRFYPAYFKTIVTGPFDCPANLPGVYPCPRDDRGAVYSGQPFDITVEAYNANNERLKNFTGDWFRTVTLSAVSAAGGTPLASNLVPQAGETKVAITKTTALFDPVANTTLNVMQASAAYRLAVGYSNLQPRATNLTAPTAVFVRAAATENVLGGNIEISSLRTGEVSDEGGVLALNGRLKVPNALGSDILRTALGLRAEYWAGAAGWLANPAYADAAGAPGTATRFLSCSPKFASAGTTCDTNVAAASSPQQVRLARGAGVLWLRAPGKLAGGAARSGNVTLQFDGWPWLPSTIGRVTFGTHRSPVIYVREMYF
ncbi:DUF6701 domain-containing protein [Massilia sp. SYSU DXS3249]